MSSEWDTDNFKIKDLVDANFDDLPANLVDFKRHLKPEVALEKSVVMRPDGRPDKSLYYYNEVLIAIIHFYFIVDMHGLLSRRTEHLHYIKTDEAEGPAVTIKDKTYNPDDIKFVIAEKEQARKGIVQDMEATILGVLTLAFPELTSEQVVEIGVTFSHALQQQRDDFVIYGLPYFKEAVAALDPADPGFEWLAVPLPGVGTLQDYIVGKLTYASTSNHPDA